MNRYTDAPVPSNEDVMYGGQRDRVTDTVDKGDLSVINDQIMHANSSLYEVLGLLMRINSGLFGPVPERILEADQDRSPLGSIPNIHLNIKLQKEILEQVFEQLSRLQRL